MGGLLTYCLKAAGGELSPFTFGRSPPGRRQAMQNLLADKDNPCVDGRKASMLPPQAVNPSTPSQLSPSASPSASTGASGAAGGGKEKYTGPHGTSGGRGTQRPTSFPFADSLRESVI